MRKIRISESQLEKLLGEGVLPYLSNVGDAAEIPDNAYGTQIATDNLDKDAETDVTTADNISHKRSNIRYGYLAGTRRNFEESVQRNISEDLDNNKVYGFGVKADNYIQSNSNNGGKMASNIADRLNNKQGQSLHTTDVEVDRMEDAKENDPSTYIKNGGDKTLEFLKSTAKRQRAFGATTRDTNKNVGDISNPANTETPNVNKGTGKGHSTDKPNFFYENS